MYYVELEIDGVFLPPSGRKGVVFFSEVQFQLDKKLYERLWSESSRYFYQNCTRFSDWQAVVIYPSRCMEQKNVHAHRSLLNGGQVHRVYLNELGDVETLPLGLAVMVLTTKTQRQMPRVAKALLARNCQEVTNPAESRAIMEMISTIVVYKFTHLSRKEVDAMLGVRLQETRVYQEAQEEGERSLLSLLLNQKFGALPDSLTVRVDGLIHDRLEALAVALVHLESIADLETWLDNNA